MGNQRAQCVVARLKDAGADARDYSGALDAEPSEVLVSDVIRLAILCGVDPQALFEAA